MRNLSLAGIILVALLGLSLLAGAFIAGAAFWKVHGRSIVENYGPKKAEPAVSHDRLARALRSDGDVQMEKDFREHPFMVDKEKASNLLISIHDTAGNPIPNHSLEVIIPGYRRVSYRTQTDSKGEVKVEVVQGARTLVVPYIIHGYALLPSMHELTPSKKFEEVPFVALPPGTSPEGKVLEKLLESPANQKVLNRDIEKELSPRPVWLSFGYTLVVHADDKCPNLAKAVREGQKVLKKRQVKMEGEYNVIIEDGGNAYMPTEPPIHCKCAPIQ